MPSKLIFGACNPIVQSEIDTFFIVKSCRDVIRVGIPEHSALHGLSEHWEFHAIASDGRILASHRVLKHIDFGSEDELLDRGIALEELLDQ